MDVNQLHDNICATYASDLLTTSQFPQSSNLKWTIVNGLLHLNGQIHIPYVLDLHLQVLRNKHDHLLAGHSGQNKILELIRQEYTWPNLRSFFKDDVSTCAMCKHLKAPWHKPYGLLKQLLIPTCPWDSISMDFVEHLPPSSGFTSILVIIERLTKQGIFIPTYDTITSAQLAELFILHVFYKHGVPSNVTSDWFQVRVALLLKSRHSSGHEPSLHFQIQSGRQWSDGTGKPNLGTVLTLLLQLSTG